MMIETINPTTEQPIKQYHCLQESGIENTLVAADKAQRSWQATSVQDRAKWLDAIADQLDAAQEECAQCMTEEMGKPITQARSEVAKCAVMCRFFAKNGPAWCETEVHQLDHQTGYLSYEPYGVVLAILPWNYPFSMAFRILATALLAGNAVLLKHAPNVQGCAHLIIDLLHRAGLPEGVVQNIVISVNQVAKVIADPRVHAVSFTGSRQAGAKVAALAGAAIKKIVLELGGSDPYLILADADLELAAKHIVSSRMNNAGQVCIAAKRVICLPAQEQVLIDLLLQHLDQYPMSDPQEDACRLGPMARADLRESLHTQVQQACQQGVQCVLGGEFKQGIGYYYPPTLLLLGAHHRLMANEEFFGPVLGLATAQDEQQLWAMANDTPYGLGAALFSRDESRARELATQYLQVGACAINQKLSSHAALPFGGRKQSGFGCELGLLGLRTWQQQKTLLTLSG
jgi:succinate-semialdehyde dehydrogenase / glutarate-semialdehyde dehydrogenase